MNNHDDDEEMEGSEVANVPQSWITVMVRGVTSEWMAFQVD
jgi:hypothetical protein